MPLTAAQIEAKIDKLEANLDRLDLLVNGDSSTDVTVDTGVLPSWAKFLLTMGALPSNTYTGLGQTINANYTVVTGDAGQLLERGASTSYIALTFGAPAGYANTHLNVLVNPETNTRAWKIIINGAVNLLWPGNAMIVQKIGAGSAWRVIKIGKRYKVIGSSTTLYVQTDVESVAQGLAAGDPTNALLVNDGLGTDAMLGSLGAAFIWRLTDFDLDQGAQPGITVKMRDGAHSTGLHLGSMISGETSGNYSVLIQGNPNDSRNVVLSALVGEAIGVYNNAWLTLEGITINCQTAQSAVVARGAGASIRFKGARGETSPGSGIYDLTQDGRPRFGIMAGGSQHIQMVEGATLYDDVGHTIAGNSDRHILLQRGAKYFGSGIIDYVVNSAFSDAWLLADGASYAEFGAAITNHGFTIASGKDYGITNGSGLVRPAANTSPFTGTGTGGTVDASSWVV